MDTIHVDLTLDQVIELSQGKTVTGYDHYKDGVEHTLDGTKIDPLKGLDLVIDGYPEQVQHDGVDVEIYVL